ncbi:MAG TPA: DUF6054 family protein [Marmoricola sp.]|jgi:hypothetical protein|nr:DUF6054 family protein [Marmoricola sp.]
MTHYEQQLTGDVDQLVAHLDQAIPQGSITAKLEDGTDQRIGDARMVVRVYERYSAMGGNRVSLSISILSVGDQLALTATTSGGSQAMFFKMNTFGEEAFLRRAVEAIESYAP